MADIDESVYLNAARAADEVGPKPFANYIERLAARPDFRAAVESAWEARGKHDAATIQRVRALAEEWRRRADFALFGALLTEALDAQRPAPPAEPAIDVVTGQPCTVYVPPEDCSTPRSCRVHRGAFPAPAPTRSGWVPEDGTPVRAIIQSDGSAGTFVVEPVGGEGRTDG